MSRGKYAPDQRSAFANSKNTSIAKSYTQLLLDKLKPSSVLETHTATTTKSSINQYVYLRKKKPLGTGASSTVYLVEDSAKKKYALKVMSRSILARLDLELENQAKMFDVHSSVLVEVAILKKLQHKNLVQLHEVIDVPKSDRLYLVMEYVQGSRQGRRISQVGVFLAYDVVRRRICDVIAGLDHLHSHSVCHRDIKPENLLLSEDGTVKMCDFGISHVFGPDGDGEGDDTLSSRTAGTLQYQAPEMFEEHANYHGRSADMWAVGCVLHWLLLGSPPFVGSSKSVEKAIRGFATLDVKERPAPCEPMPAGMRDVLLRILVRDPVQRATIAELATHPYLREQLDLPNHVPSAAANEAVSEGGAANSISSKPSSRSVPMEVLSEEDDASGGGGDAGNDAGDAGDDDAVPAATTQGSPGRKFENVP